MGFLRRLEKQLNNGEKGEYWDMASRPGLSKKLPFLVVQEGIWKNQATERVREFLSSKFSDRAEIELRYIRLLQDWLDDLDPPRDHNDAADSYMDSLIVKGVVGCLKKEATGQIDVRQKVYNAIMNDLGPYSAIRRKVVSHNKTLDWVVEQFKIISAEDKKGEREQRIHSEKKEHIMNQIEALENQLSNRSRLTSARRRQGTKKIDAMRHRTSFLRKQLQDEEEMIRVAERELLNIETKATGELGKMESVLKDLEKIRMQNIMQQTRLFIQSMLNREAQGRRSACMADTLRQCLKDVTEAETQVDKNWEDVSANALRAQAGQTFKLRQLFEVPAKRSKSADSRKSEDSLRIAEIEANRLIDLDGKAGLHLSQISAKTSQQGTPFPEETPDTKSPTMVEVKSALHDFPREALPQAVSDKQRSVVDVVSETSIEEIHLPPETRNGSSGGSSPRPPIIRNGWLKEASPRTAKVQIEDNDWNSDRTRVNDVNNKHSQIPRIFNQDGRIDVGHLRDIRVIAVSDYTATSPRELSFKKGQVIKQKAGEDERGFCYGWTRDHRLFPKRYGFYPKSVVRIEGFQ